MKKLLLIYFVISNLFAFAQDTTEPLDKRLEKVVNGGKTAEDVIKHAIFTNDLDMFNHGVTMAGKDIKKMKYSCNDMNINKGTMFLGFTPLMHAAALNRIDMVKILIDKKVDLDADCSAPIYTGVMTPNYSGKMKGLTAIMLAAQQGNKEIVELLVNAGADILTKEVEIKPISGTGMACGPTQWAKVHNQTEIEEFLKKSKKNAMKNMWKTGGMK